MDFLQNSFYASTVQWDRLVIIVALISAPSFSPLPSNVTSSLSLGRSLFETMYDTIWWPYLILVGAIIPLLPPSTVCLSFCLSTKRVSYIVGVFWSHSLAETNHRKLFQIWHRAFLKWTQEIFWTVQNIRHSQVWQKCFQKDEQKEFFVIQFCKIEMLQFNNLQASSYSYRKSIPKTLSVPNHSPWNSAGSNQIHYPRILSINNQTNRYQTIPLLTLKSRTRIWK